MHGYNALTPIDEALDALDTVVRTGKARYVSVSNWMAHRVARALGPRRYQDRYLNQQEFETIAGPAGGTVTEPM